VTYIPWIEQAPVAEGGGGNPDVPVVQTETIAKLRDVALLPDCVFALGAAPYWPAIADYAAGGFTPSELGGLKGLPLEEAADGVFINEIRGIGGLTNAGVLSCVGDLTIATWFEVIDETQLPDAAILSHGIAGDGDPALNYIFSYRINDGGYSAEFYCEDGTGTDRLVEYFIPGGLPQGVRASISFIRTAAGGVTGFLNGFKLGFVRNLTGAVDAGDGDVTGLAANDGTGGSLNTPTQVPGMKFMGYILLNDAPAAPPSQIANAFTDYEITPGLPDDATIDTAASVAEWAFRADAGGITDLLGSIDAGGGFTLEPGTQRLIGDRYVLTSASDSQTNTSGSNPAFKLNTDYIVDLSFMYRGGTTFIAGMVDTGESEPTNYLWSVNITDPLRIRFFGEHTGGRDINIYWNAPKTIVAGDCFRVILTATDNGDGTSDFTMSANGEALTVESATAASGTAVNNVTFATVTHPTGGSLSYFTTSAGNNVRHCAMVDLS